MKLTEAQLVYLSTINAGHPDPVTIRDDGEHLRALWDADLIDVWDMWPDGTRRWIITPAGRAAVQAAKEGK